MYNDRPVIAHRVIRGLRITTSTTSGNLTPQETRKQDSPDIGRGGVVRPALVAAW